MQLFVFGMIFFRKRVHRPETPETMKRSTWISGTHYFIAISAVQLQRFGATVVNILSINSCFLRKNILRDSSV